MQQPIDMKRFEQLKAAGDLPSPRGVAIAIIRLTQSMDVSMAELARVIKGDPAFVGRLIKAANGSLGKGRRAVVSVQDALMVLGLPAVRTMALGFSLLSNYRRGACEAFDYTRFWSFSLVMALSMQALALRVRMVASDEAFSLGLLARVGELALTTLYPAEFGRVLHEIAAAPASRQLDLEQAAFAMNHCELGAAMLLDWGMPLPMANAARFYETPERAGICEDAREAALMQCLVLSRAIAQLCLAPESEHARLMAPMLRLSGRLGVSRGDFVALCEQIGRDWGEWGRLLLLDTGRVPAFTELSARDETAVAKTAAPAGEACPESGADARVAQEPDGGRAAEADKVLRVLVVGATDEERGRIRAALKTSEFFFVDGNDDDLVIERAIDVQPQLMIIDWSQDDCADWVRALRSTRFGRSLYLLALLDSLDDTILGEAAEAGVDDFLARPVRTSALSVRLKAGRRTIALQRRLEHESEELRHFAAELAISNRRLQEAAMTDVLTGVPNRRYAIDRMQMEWTACARHHRPLSVMIVDLDDFKEVNDAHGHDVGDMALRQVADALRSELRVQDVVCRTGGDEFLVICPDSDLNAALACGERLRAAAAGLQIDTGGPSLRLSVSIGVATRDDSMPGMKALTKLADRGAFLAKQRGRNCVVALQVPGSAF
ncbi:sensor domain-containing diguanylate cyclase [Thauera linaloolentis]|uniref:diguanylate cyclase n=1 Tax=Thauera linaloolentis (strain DSM 12138 / JCM 21573 / CCUG 41526 / CIP 105981 / IAM 15112 / NBRC 102519 / 47Lol) TaxID=1123367 RepID=N6Y052_THAL4|nr:diguanylate cyclase [Thauera linaloolentis]ENO87506.1 response regulator receiver modulated diguanylate cyclase [Thauera linaloolentis 47Lol = DSM 12138]MCM8565529.1 diguanylate cyclase [Thauera linaloolentis]